MNEVQFGMNQYCGPAVLSIFSGLDTDTCAEKISEITGKSHVTGVIPTDLIKAGNKLGLEFKLNEAFEGRSLFWTASALVNFPGQYLITIPRHYITIEVKDRQIQICDNHTKTPMDLQNSARLSQKVERVWKVTKVFDYVKPHIVSDDIKVYTSMGAYDINRVTKYSDGSEKVKGLGSIVTDNKLIVRLIAHELLRLSGEE